MRKKKEITGIDKLNEGINEEYLFINPVLNLLFSGSAKKGIEIPALYFLYSAPKVGKTHLALEISYWLLKQGKVIWYISTEGGIKRVLLEKMDFYDTFDSQYIKNKFFIMNISDEEIFKNKILNNLEKILEKDEYRKYKPDLIIIDSFTQIISKDYIYTKQIGVLAKLKTKIARALRSYAQKLGFSVIFIGQVAMKLNILNFTYEDKADQVKAVEHLVDNSFKIKKDEVYKIKDVEVGARIKFHIDKSRYFNSGIIFEPYYIIYGSREGFYLSLLEHLIKVKVLKVKGYERKRKINIFELGSDISFIINEDIGNIYKKGQEVSFKEFSNFLKVNYDKLKGVFTELLEKESGEYRKKVDFISLVDKIKKERKENEEV